MLKLPGSAKAQQGDCQISSIALRQELQYRLRLAMKT